MFAKLYLEITSRCNLACSFCPGTTRPAKFLTVEEFSALARRLRPHGPRDFLQSGQSPRLFRVEERRAAPEHRRPLLSLRRSTTKNSGGILSCHANTE